MGGIYKVNKTSGELSQIAGGTLYADLPIGSWVKNDMTTTPAGFLKYGDTISPTEYPELYAKYGSTVPYKADTSELSDYSQPITFEQITAGYTMPYDGVMNIGANSTAGNTIASISINGEETVDIGARSYTGTFVKFKKGDVVRAHNITTTNFILKVAYYTKSLIVKAKNVGVPTDFIAGIRSMSSSVVGNNTKLVTGEAVYNFNYRAKDTSITSDWIAIDNIASDWVTSITSLKLLAARLGKRRDVYLNFSPANAESAKTNGLFPSYSSGMGGLLHIVTGLTDTYGRGFAEYLSERSSDAILTARTNNWVNDWYWEKPKPLFNPANYTAIGTIFTGNTIRGYGKADVTLYPNGIARVDYAIEITTSYVANEFGYGISPDALHTINSNIPLITPATPDPKGNYLWFINGASGIIKRSNLGYSSAHGQVKYNNKLYWQLGRIYNTSATYGGWPTSEFAVGDYITGTCWGTFNV